MNTNQLLEKIEALKLTIASLEDSVSYWRKVAKGYSGEADFWKKAYKDLYYGDEYIVGKAVYEIVNEQRGVPRTPFEEQPN